MNCEANIKELPRHCPLCNREIECSTCYEICLVSEGTFPTSELPPGLEYTEENAEKCMKCPNHIE